MTRRLTNWIDSFDEYMADRVSSRYLRTFGALSAIASVAERRVWADSLLGPLYPNLYTLLIGEPGTHKTVTYTAVTRLLRQSGCVHMAPADMTKAAILDAMRDAERQINYKGQDGQLRIDDYHAMSVHLSEFKNLIPEYTTEKITLLTDLYDCGDVYSERRRVRDEQTMDINFPCLNILACATPEMVQSHIPASAWKDGFTARWTYAWAGERVPSKIFGDDPRKEERRRLEAALVVDLRAIGDVYGQMLWDREVIEAHDDWALTNWDGPPVHPKMEMSLTRRGANVQKFTTLASLARSNDRHVIMEDWQRARQWQQDSEDCFAEIWTRATQSQAATQIDIAFKSILRMYERQATDEAGNRPRLPKHIVMDKLSETFDLKTWQVLDLLVQQRKLIPYPKSETEIFYLPVNPKGQDK